MLKCYEILIIHFVLFENVRIMEKTYFLKISNVIDFKSAQNNIIEQTLKSTENQI